MRTCQFGWQCPGRKRTVGQSPVRIRKAISGQCFLFAATLLEQLPALWATNPQAYSVVSVEGFIFASSISYVLSWKKDSLVMSDHCRLDGQCQSLSSWSLLPNTSNGWEFWWSSVTNAGHSFGLLLDFYSLRVVPTNLLPLALASNWQQPLM